MSNYLPLTGPLVNIGYQIFSERLFVSKEQIQFSALVNTITHLFLTVISLIPTIAKSIPSFTPWVFGGLALISLIHYVAFKIGIFSPNLRNQPAEEMPSTSDLPVGQRIAPFNNVESLAAPASTASDLIPREVRRAAYEMQRRNEATRLRISEMARKLAVRLGFKIKEEQERAEPADRQIEAAGEERAIRVPQQPQVGPAGPVEAAGEERSIRVPQQPQVGPAGPVEAASEERAIRVPQQPQVGPAGPVDDDEDAQIGLAGLVDDDEQICEDAIAALERATQGREQEAGAEAIERPAEIAAATQTTQQQSNSLREAHE
jgi:hypothetical protein